jgi:hypothetical protein
MATMTMVVTWAEMDFCFYKLGRAGSFMTSLIDTIFKADDTNRKKIAKGYPELIEVIDRYNREKGYWADLVERWNESYPNGALIA